eukprot:CAMPEP_0115561818 /NCGR_PEP_ID=MMETSP0271-20121206/101180_1 /TAXON_ID=71861 /ORGANISM="Scrippsiella trochoidea, Strain CCMP3099" /LENGTH=44 /DNA_ID= /DNA_START= /DNA_END= /DNA_ORIENTATION=
MTKPAMSKTGTPTDNAMITGSMSLSPATSKVTSVSFELFEAETK